MLGRITGNTDTLDSPRPRLGGSHHLPPYSILCVWPQNLHPNDFSLSGFPSGNLESRWLGFSRIWNPITLRADLGSRCGLKQSYSFHWVFFNGMPHTLCSQVNWVNSRLFLVITYVSDVQMSNASPLDIYIPRAFQSYKERHKPLNFDPWNCSLKFRKSNGTPSPKVGVALGVWGFNPSYSLTLSYTPGSVWCDSRVSSWPAPLRLLCFDSQAPTWSTPLQALWFGREPKARVVTLLNTLWNTKYLKKWLVHQKGIVPNFLIWWQWWIHMVFLIYLSHFLQMKHQSSNGVTFPTWKHLKKILVKNLLGKFS